jgi:hypothetical protein
MPPRTALSTPLRAWKCPSCRTFATTPSRNVVGPEHPRYISFPEPPQQTKPTRKWMKGILPVPRNVFAGTRGTDVSSDDSLALSTKDAAEPKSAPAGSREAWKLRMAEQRKQNLREGVRELKRRQEVGIYKFRTQQAQKQRAREELVAMPEREDERLTTPSHNLDLEALYHGAPPDPSRETRLAAKRERHSTWVASRESERANSLHTLYAHARSFIVTPAQLDASIEEAFGTNDNPVTFNEGQGSGMRSAASMWNYGNPQSVQDMLNRANNARGGQALSQAGRVMEVNQERVKRIAEALTGGKMDDGNVERRREEFGGDGGFSGGL